VRTPTTASPLVQVNAAGLVSTIEESRWLLVRTPTTASPGLNISAPTSNNRHRTCIYIYRASYIKWVSQPKATAESNLRLCNTADKELYVLGVYVGEIVIFERP
jgi:hypothetical protein